MKEGYLKKYMKGDYSRSSDKYISHGRDDSRSLIPNKVEEESQGEENKSYAHMLNTVAGCLLEAGKPTAPEKGTLTRS